jgi:hypothetical protein
MQSQFPDLKDCWDIVLQFTYARSAAETATICTYFTSGAKKIISNSDAQESTLSQNALTLQKKNILFRDRQWLVQDYKKVQFANRPDIIFSSLFCHHFTSEELIAQLKWMQQNSTLGFFINDLQRNWFAYYSIRLITKCFSSSYLVRNDAPLSVARGFHKNEWTQLLREAGIKNYSIGWKWAFRYLITSNN